MDFNDLHEQVNEEGRVEYEDGSYIEIIINDHDEESFSTLPSSRTFDVTTTYVARNWFDLVLWESTLSQRIRVTNGVIDCYANSPSLSFTSEFWSTWTASDVREENQDWDDGGVYAHGRAQVRAIVLWVPIQEGTIHHYLYINRDGSVSSKNSWLEI